MLQLETNKQIWLEQERHFEEIHVWFLDIFLKDNPDFFNDLIDKDFEQRLLEEFQEIDDKEFEKNTNEE